MQSFVEVPNEGTVKLTNARAPSCFLDGTFPVDRDGVAALELVLQVGRIASIDPPQSSAEKPETATVDLRGGLVWPAFVELHTHLDKGHIWPRAENPDGTFEGALEASAADQEAGNWTADDLRRRMEFALKTAYAHGTRAIRTHLDSSEPQFRTTWPVFAGLREEWTGRIELQAVSLTSIEGFEPGFREDLVSTVKVIGGVFGAVTYMVPNLEANLRWMFETASREGLDLDFHVDESLDPGAASLAVIAKTALETGYQGKIVCGHCCSLSVQEGEEVKRTLDLVAKAGITIVSLPMCNLYLQDRSAGRTPRLRGTTLLHEIKALGIPIAISSDNTRDPFYGYGDLDALEVFTHATRIAHLDRPFADWPLAITDTPAKAMGLEQSGRLQVGEAADLVLFNARSYSELLSRPQSDRAVLRAGKAIDRSLPDYRELDDLFQVGV